MVLPLAVDELKINIVSTLLCAGMGRKTHTCLNIFLVNTNKDVRHGY